MVRKTLLLVLVLAFAGSVAAGCGSSSSSSSKSSGAGASSTPATGGSTTSAGGTSSSGSSASSNPSVQQAVAACKSSINAQPTLSASLKSKLTSICDKAATGDEAGVKKATAEVCQDIVKATVPSSAQAQALAACPKA